MTTTLINAIVGIAAGVIAITGGMIGYYHYVVKERKKENKE